MPKKIHCWTRTDDKDSQYTVCKSDKDVAAKYKKPKAVAKPKAKPKAVAKPKAKPKAVAKPKRISRTLEKLYAKIS
jgi:hypothetical protein